MIIGAAQKKELKEKVEFLRGFRMFSQLRTNVIEKIQYYMKTKVFRRGQKVYSENFSHVDGIYFITQGEFEVSQISQIQFETEKGKPAQRQNGVKYKSQSRIHSSILTR